VSVFNGTEAENELLRKLQILATFIVFFSIGYLAVVLPVFIIEYFSEAGINAGNHRSPVADSHTHHSWPGWKPAVDAAAHAQSAVECQSDEQGDSHGSDQDDPGFVIEDYSGES
jgi:hypothetical protein